MIVEAIFNLIFLLVEVVLDTIVALLPQTFVLSSIIDIIPVLELFTTASYFFDIGLLGRMISVWIALQVVLLSKRVAQEVYALIPLKFT